METIRLTAWKDFDSEIQSIRNRYGYYEDPVEKEKMKNTLLFRGQADAQWAILTTLERRVSEPFHILRYMECVSQHQNEIESFTGIRWNIPPFEELREKVDGRTRPASFIQLPAYDYLVYLRHHGFPSPLLDWTESPYVAAYFACIGPPDKDRAVFCFIGKTDGSKGGMVADAKITEFGPYVRTDKRHFAQKAWYTTCTKRNADNRDYFCPHEEAFKREDPRQDLLVKIILPAAERRAALLSLNDYNINHFTLFQSEDSLVQALASRTFDINGEK